MFKDIYKQLHTLGGFTFERKQAALFLYHLSLMSVWDIFNGMPNVNQKTKMSLFQEGEFGDFYHLIGENAENCDNERQLNFKVSDRDIDVDLIGGNSKMCTLMFLQKCWAQSEDYGLNIYNPQTEAIQRFIQTIAYLAAKRLNKDEYLMACFANKNAVGNDPIAKILKRAKKYQGVFTEIENSIAAGNIQICTDILGEISPKGQLTNVNAAYKGFQEAYDNMPYELRQFNDQDMVYVTTHQVIANYKKTLRQQSQKNYDTIVGGVKYLAYDNIPIKPIEHATPNITKHVWGENESRIILTHKENLYHAYDTDADELKMRLKFDEDEDIWRLKYASRTGANFGFESLISVVS